MRYLLAKPYPDELLGSVWVRTVRRTEVPLKRISRAVSGGAPAKAALLHLGLLRPMAELLRTTPEELLWNHTVFPYSTAYYPEAALTRALASVHTSELAARGIGRIVQSVADYARLRRFCPLCTEEELARTGESYWHRLHNLPGVLLCLAHSCRLSVSSLPTQGRIWHEVLPHDLSARRVVRVDANADPFAWELATLSSNLFGRAPFARVERDANWLREALRQKSLVGAGRSVDSRRLQTWFRGHVRDFDGLGLTPRDRKLDWLAGLIRPGNEALALPFKRLLLEAALVVQGPVSGPILNHVPRGHRAVAPDTVDGKFAAAVRAVVNRYIRLGERVRVEDALAEAGCWSRYRHANGSYPKVRAEIERLKASSAAMRPNWGKGDQRRREA